MRVVLKPEVSLDTVVAVLLLLGALTGLYMNLDSRLVRVETKLDILAQPDLRGGR